MTLRVLGLACGIAVIFGVHAYGQTPNCRHVKSNRNNAGAITVVGTTAVTVIPANTSRCSLVITNATSNPMFCADVDSDPVPTASTGSLIGGNTSLTMGLEGQGRWQCIRAGGSDAAASVAEGLP